MDIARDSLEIKRKTLEMLTDKGLYPYTAFYLRHLKERSSRYWDNHFSTIGLIGLNEACLNLLGCDIGAESGRAFALDVLTHMRERLGTYQNETGHPYNLEATPAEGTSYRLARLDVERFEGINLANSDELDSGAAPFYTNSSQLPVNYSEDPFEVMELQDELQCQYTGGTVLHFFVGEEVPDPAAVKSFVRTVCENYRSPYVTVTPTFSICPEHGYLRGKHTACPRCGREAEVYSRIVGYLRPVDQWNEGKLAEFGMRKSFTLAGT